MKTRILPPIHQFLGIICLAALMLVFNFSASADNGKHGKGKPMPAPAVDISTALNFYGDIDNVPAFDDDPTVGVVHMASLRIRAGGSINAVGANMTFHVDGNVTLDASITGPPLILGGRIITTNSHVIGVFPNQTLIGNDTIIAGGDINTANGSEISTTGLNGGSIYIQANGPTSKIDIDGLVKSRGTETGQSPHQDPGGGPITIIAKCNLTISPTGEVTSLGSDPGADLVHLEACEVDVLGLVQSIGAGHVTPDRPENHLNHSNRPDKPCSSTAGVEIWADHILIDKTSGNHGEVSADLSVGAGGRSWIDIFARKNITIIGESGACTVAPCQGANPNITYCEYAVHANNGGANNLAGFITVKSTEASVSATGRAFQARGGFGGSGGTINVEANNNVDIRGMSIEAIGCSNTGGHVNFRAFNGDVLNNASTLINVSGGNTDGSVTDTECGTTAWFGTVTPTNPVPVTNVCTGHPLLPCETGFVVPLYPGCDPGVCGTPYAILPLATCNQDCQPCPGAKLTIVKNLGVGTPLPSALWTFNTNIPGVPGGQFTIAKAGGSFSVSNVPPGVYTVTEVQQPVNCPENLLLPPDQQEKYGTTNTCSASQQTPQLTATFTVTNCDGNTCTFTNFAHECQHNGCQWCNKAAVLSQVWQNPGCNINDQQHRCVVPDILVDVTMTHGGVNDVVDASEIRSNSPATWSIQAAVNFATNPANAALFTGCEIFIGVVSTQPIPVDPLDPTSCGFTCARPLGGDSPWGIENVTVTNNTGKRLNIFGCSVTMKPLDPTVPFMKIIGSGSKVTVMDIHVKNSRVGYYVYNNGGLITIKNSRAMYCDTGYWVKDNNVEITGSPEISHGKIGIFLDGATNVSLRTNNSIMDNTIAGIKVLNGGTNDLNGNDCGTVGHPNGVGILGVTTNSNSIHDGTAYGNSGDGINLTGNGNTIKQNEIGDKNKGNGGDGIHFSGSGNTLDGNDVFGNGGDGIDGAGGTAASPNVIVKNNCGDKDKGNGGNGILLAGIGNGNSSPVEVDQNTTRTNGNDGIKITGTGAQLKNNTSGGGSDQNNTHCEYNVVSGNFNATGNKANNVTVPGASGSAFPNTCQGSPINNMVTLPDNPAAPQQNMLQLFPNPTKGRTTVEFLSVNAGQFSMNVIDVTGRTVRTESVQAVTGANFYELDMSKMSKGVYMVSLQNGNERIMKQVVIQ